MVMVRFRTRKQSKIDKAREWKGDESRNTTLHTVIITNESLVVLLH